MAKDTWKVFTRANLKHYLRKGKIPTVDSLFQTSCIFNDYFIF